MDTPIFKSRTMLRVEARVGRPLEDYLSDRYQTLTQPQIAQELGVSGASVSRWMREFGIEARLQGKRPPTEAVAVTYSQPESGYRNDPRTYTSTDSLDRHRNLHRRPHVCPICESVHPDPDSLDDPLADTEADADSEP